MPRRHGDWMLVLLHGYHASPSQFLDPAVLRHARRAREARARSPAARRRRPTATGTTARRDGGRWSDGGDPGRLRRDRRHRDGRLRRLSCARATAARASHVAASDEPGAGPGAFDDAQDYDADVFALTPRTPLWIASARAIRSATRLTYARSVDARTSARRPRQRFGTRTPQFLLLRRERLTRRRHVRHDDDGIDWDRRRPTSPPTTSTTDARGALRRSFENSQHVAFARDGSRVVGMARMLSDGVCNAYVVDVWTHSAYRRRHRVDAHADARRRRAGQHIGLQTDDAQDSTARSATSRSRSSGRPSPAVARQRREPVTPSRRSSCTSTSRGRCGRTRSARSRSATTTRSPTTSSRSTASATSRTSSRSSTSRRTRCRTTTTSAEIVVDYADGGGRARRRLSRGDLLAGLSASALDTDEVFSGYCDGAEEARELHGVEVRLTPDIPRGLLRRRRRRDRPLRGRATATAASSALGIGGLERITSEPFARGVRARARGRARLGSARRRGRRRRRRCGARSRRSTPTGSATGSARSRIPGSSRSSRAAGPSSTSARSRTSAPASSRSLEEHPLPQLVAAGVRCSISTDDPAMFDTDLTRDYEAAASLGVSPRAAYEAGVAGALCDDGTRDRLGRSAATLRLGSLDFARDGDCERSRSPSAPSTRCARRVSTARTCSPSTATCSSRAASRSAATSSTARARSPARSTRAAATRPPRSASRRRWAPEDVGTPLHRDMGVHITRGVEPWRIFANYMGRAGRARARPRRQRPHGRRAARDDRDGQPPARDAPGRGRLRARLPDSRGAARRGRLVRRGSLGARRRARVDDVRRHAPAPDGLRLRQQPVRLLDADAATSTRPSTSPTAPRRTASRESSSTAPTSSPSTARRSARSRRRAPAAGRRCSSA